MLERTITKTDWIMALEESFANTFTMPLGLDSDGSINFMKVTANHSTCRSQYAVLRKNLLRTTDF